MASGRNVARGGGFYKEENPRRHLDKEAPIFL